MLVDDEQMGTISTTARQLFRLTLFAGLLLDVACGKKADNAACAEPIDWYINRTVDSLQNQMAAQGMPVSREKAMDVQRDLKELLMRRCRDDGWSREVLDCVHQASRQTDINKCKASMTNTQRQRFQDQVSKLLPLSVGAQVMPGPNQSIGIGVRNVGDSDWHAVHVCVNERWCTADKGTVKPGDSMVLLWYAPGSTSDFLKDNAPSQSTDAVRTLAVIAEEGSWVNDF